MQQLHTGPVVIGPSEFHPTDGPPAAQLPRLRGTPNKSINKSLKDVFARFISQRWSHCNPQQAALA